MPFYSKKTKDEILRNALSNLQKRTPVTAVGPGSIARAFAEAISSELGDAYTAVDFNLMQSMLSTASGVYLDQIGALYGVTRNSVDTIVQLDRTVGVFYFYLDTPYNETIVIPDGTRLYTSEQSFIGRQLRWRTVGETRIEIGQIRAWATIKPDISDAPITLGKDTLIYHDFVSPPNTTVRCRNVEPLVPQRGFESDEDYRVRIQKSIRVGASGTSEALRFAALMVPGVRDVRIRQSPYGMGSFEVLVIPQSRRATDALMKRVNDRLEQVRPVGIRMFVKEPSVLPFDLTATIITDRRRGQDPDLTDRCRVAVVRYMQKLFPGDTIVYNGLINAILNVSDTISDVQITSYAPNGIEVLRRNFVPEIDQQIVPGRVVISTA